ncbi:MAG: hypothetical protein ACI4V7_07610 [Succinivibrionaceae bacterium]
MAKDSDKYSSGRYKKNEKEKPVGRGFLLLVVSLLVIGFFFVAYQDSLESSTDNDSGFNSSSTAKNNNNNNNNNNINKSVNSKNSKKEYFSANAFEKIPPIISENKDLCGDDRTFKEILSSSIQNISVKKRKKTPYEYFPNVSIQNPSAFERSLATSYVIVQGSIKYWDGFSKNVDLLFANKMKELRLINVNINGTPVIKDEEKIKIIDLICETSSYHKI